MSVDGFVFQACSFNHSDISPSLESITCKRPERTLRAPRSVWSIAVLGVTAVKSQDRGNNLSSPF